MDLTVVIPTVPGRAHLLAEAVGSVIAQTEPYTEIRIVRDERRTGPSTTRNRGAAHLTTEWVAFLDDDDTWNPNHLATLAAHAGDADVVYSLATIEGRPGWDPQQRTFDPDRLRRENYIPNGGIIRSSFFDSVTGYPADGQHLYEDWGLWLELLDADARFHCVPERTWTYRIGDWDSRHKEVLDGRRTASPPFNLDAPPGTVAIVVPYAVEHCTDDPCEHLTHRDDVWTWVRAWYEHHFPEIPIVVASDPGSGAWSKGRAVRAAIDQTDADVLIVADADSIPEPDALRACLAALDTHPWATPHIKVRRLRDEWTEKLLKRPAHLPIPYDHRARFVERAIYGGPAGGGITVLPRSTYLACPIDPRFEQWGGEDLAWGRALARTVGDPHRVDSPLLHLWHPPAANHWVPTAGTNVLAERYRRAFLSPDIADMAALISEVVPS